MDFDLAVMSVTPRAFCLEVVTARPLELQSLDFDLAVMSVMPMATGSGILTSPLLELRSLDFDLAVTRDSRQDLQSVIPTAHRWALTRDWEGKRQ